MTRSTTNWIFVTPLVIAVLALTRPRLTGGSDTVDKWVDLLGLSIAILGLTIRIVARDWKASRVQNGLVTTGPYSIMRHPMYLASYLAGLGLCVIMGDLIFALAFTAIYIVVHAFVAKREERFLMAKWQEEYKAYKANVPAFLPSPIRLIKKIMKRKPWVSSKRAAIGRELGTICGILGGAIILEVREDILAPGRPRPWTEIVVLLALMLVIFVVWVVHTVRRQPEGSVSA